MVASKTKVMSVNTKPDLTVQQVTLEGQPVEAVQTFNYLGTLQPQQVNNRLRYVSDALFSKEFCAKQPVIVRCN